MSGRRWQQIDSLLKQDLVLDDDDVCFFYLVRTSGGFAASEANSRIEDFKKKPELYRDRPDVWCHKEREVRTFARDVEGFLSSVLQPGHGVAALVPAPTSKPKSHPHHDSRLADMCGIVADDMRGAVCVEDVLDVTCHSVASHMGGTRDVDSLVARMSVAPLAAVPSVIFVVDDVITTGAHYMACKRILQATCPGIPIVGLFLAVHKSDHVDYQYDFIE